MGTSQSERWILVRLPTVSCKYSNEPFRPTVLFSPLYFLFVLFIVCNNDNNINVAAEDQC